LVCWFCFGCHLLKEARWSVGIFGPVRNALSGCFSNICGKVTSIRALFTRRVLQPFESREVFTRFTTPPVNQTKICPLYLRDSDSHFARKKNRQRRIFEVTKQRLCCLPMEFISVSPHTGEEASEYRVCDRIIEYLRAIMGIPFVLCGNSEHPQG
jgi:hypothetical protein